MERRVKYFLVQRVASLVYFFSVVLTPSLEQGLEGGLILVSMVIKIGMAPFHAWFLRVFSTASWRIIFLLSTVQKTIPLLVISQNAKYLRDMWVVLLLTLVIVVIWGAKHIIMRKILALSSLRNVRWILVSMLQRALLWGQYICIYGGLLAPVLWALSYRAPQTRTQALRGGLSLFKTGFLLIAVFSIGGLPPLLGFLNKLLIIKRALESTTVVLLIIVVLSSLCLLYFYTGLFFILLRAPAEPVIHAQALYP